MRNTMAPFLLGKEGTEPSLSHSGQNASTLANSNALVMGFFHIDFFRAK